MCSVEKSVLRYFANFTGEHLNQGLSFDNVADRKSATLLKKEHSGRLLHFYRILWTTASGIN